VREALLDQLDVTGCRADLAYHFTDLRSLLTLQRLVPNPGCRLAFSTLDIRPLRQRDAAYNSYSLACGVNARRVISFLENLAGPGLGVLVWPSACGRSGNAAASEFVFNLLSSFRDPVLFLPGAKTGF
jgi:hypothetical protein